MSAGVNKVILLGNLGSDPELRQTGSGKSVCSFTLATNDRDTTEWHRIVTWERLAETCGEHLAKGRQVYIEGRLQTREWADQDGAKRQTTEIVAYSVQFLGGAGQGNQQQPQQQSSSWGQSKKKQASGDKWGQK